MSGISFPQKTWTGADMDNLFKLCSCRWHQERRFSATGGPTPPPPPPPLPVFKGSRKALLYPFCPASHFSCNKFIYTYVWPLPHLSTDFTTSHLILLCSHPCPVIPPVPLMTNTKAFLCLRISVTQTVLPTSAPVAAVGCYVWSPSCLSPGDAKHLSGLQWSGNRASRVSPSCEAMNSSHHFPKWLLETPKLASLPPGGTHVWCSWSCRARPLPGWAASSLHQDGVLLNYAPGLSFHSPFPEKFP